MDENNYIEDKFYYNDFLKYKNNHTLDEYNNFIKNQKINLDVPENYDYEIPIIDIINNKEKFKDIIDILLSDDYHFMVRFNYLLSLLD